MKRLAILLLFALFLLATATPAFSQVSPIGGLGSIQLLDNTGKPAISGCFYFYQAGTSTQQASFTDSSGATQNTNPLCLTTGARANGVWLTTSALYKIVACQANDGAACNGGDILWSQDNVPGGATSGGGGGGAPFISTSANPATSGTLRLSTGDTTCWRNAANSANLCISKDTNDVLTLFGALKAPSVSTPSGFGAGFGWLWHDNTANRWMVSNNGASAKQLVVSGNDIDLTDAVTKVHFGATQIPFNSTAPTTGQNLQFNGTNIIGVTPPVAVSEATMGGFLSGSTVACSSTTPTADCIVYIFANTHTLVRVVIETQLAPSGCGTNAVVGVKDVTSGTVLNSATPTTLGYTDSGAISVSMTAGDKIGVGVLTGAVGCTTFPAFSAVANYQ